jgi:hypothetical protein
VFEQQDTQQRDRKRRHLCQPSGTNTAPGQRSSSQR